MQATVKQFETYSKSEWVKKQQLLVEQSQRQEDSMIRTLEELDRKASDNLHHRQLQLQKQAEVIILLLYRLIHSDHCILFLLGTK